MSAVLRAIFEEGTTDAVSLAGFLPREHLMNDVSWVEQACPVNLPSVVRNASRTSIQEISRVEIRIVFTRLPVVDRGNDIITSPGEAVGAESSNEASIVFIEPSSAVSNLNECIIEARVCSPHGAVNQIGGIQVGDVPLPNGPGSRAVAIDTDVEEVAGGVHSNSPAAREGRVKPRVVILGVVELVDEDHRYQIEDLNKRVLIGPPNSRKSFQWPFGTGC